MTYEQRKALAGQFTLAICHTTAALSPLSLPKLLSRLLQDYRMRKQERRLKQGGLRHRIPGALARDWRNRGARLKNMLSPLVSLLLYIMIESPMNRLSRFLNCESLRQRYLSSRLGPWFWRVKQVLLPQSYPRNIWYDPVLGPALIDSVTSIEVLCNRHESRPAQKCDCLPCENVIRDEPQDRQSCSSSDATNRGTKATNPLTSLD